MKAFTNANPRDARHAATLARQARADGRRAAFAGGGSDLLALVKDRIVEPDVIIHLGGIKGVDRVESSSAGLTVGGLITLDALSRHEAVRGPFAVLAEAAASVATPQIRNVGTLAGNVCQRPWCWFFRNGFPCYKAGGNQCFSVTGENEFNAIFGGSPSYIVHPSDTAPALVALDATFQITGVGGDRTLSSSEFFTLPRQNAAKENALADDEVLVSVRIPARRSGVRSTYQKVMDRETWTHAVVSAAVVSRWRRTSAAALEWCWAASRQFRGGSRKSRSCWPVSGSPTRCSGRRATRPSRARGRSRRTPTRYP